MSNLIGLLVLIILVAVAYFSFKYGALIYSVTSGVAAVGLLFRLNAGSKEA